MMMTQMASHLDSDSGLESNHPRPLARSRTTSSRSLAAALRRPGRRSLSPRGLRQTGNPPIPTPSPTPTPSHHPSLDDEPVKMAAHLAQPSSLHHDRPSGWARTDSEPQPVPVVAVSLTPTRSQNPSGAPIHEFSDRDRASSDAGRGPASAHHHGVIIGLGLRLGVAVWHYP